MWIRSKRDEYGVQRRNDKLNVKETKLERFRRELNEIKTGEYQYRQPRKAHSIVRRDLGKIVRRSTKRPHLSRKFKSQSMKRYKQDCRLASMLTRLASNITIVPEFLNYKQIMEDVKKYNLSTIYYVYDNVAYFGSLPPKLLSSIYATVPSTGPKKAVTYELGATKVLGANIFDGDKGASERVSPVDVEVPNIEEVQNKDPKLEPQIIEKEPQNIEKDEKTAITESLENETTKLKRTRKKKTGDNNETSDTTKRTRAKRKSTKSIINTNSLENSPNSVENQDTSSSKTKSKTRKVRSVGELSEKQIRELLPALLYVQNNMHLRRRRDVKEETENSPKKEQGEEKKIGHFGKLKEKIKQSKNNLFSFVREKKESLIDMPRRARYIAREMYLDGKFFFQELKEVPDRIKKDITEKKELLSLVWDMLKIFMPVTEVGEEGGTTPETKIVEDPKQYVKNPEDYLTPNLSDLKNTVAISEKPKIYDYEETSKSTQTEKVTTEKTTEKSTVTIKTKRDFKEIVRTTIKTSTTESNTFSPTEFISSTTENRQTESTLEIHNEPVLVTDNPITEKTYRTKIVNPGAEETTLPFLQEEIVKKVNDEKTFDQLSKSLKDKNFMDNLIKRANNEQMQEIYSKVNPADMMKKINKGTLERMGKLMGELDSSQLAKMQELAKNIYGGGKKSPVSSNNKIEKNR
ncbi:uncharacterized protein LOC103513850 isoform X3 [Diaphorina citri]|nr:uncharacterized protein LOC103513850 isoform X3 [Diaphorina citri]